MGRKKVLKWSFFEGQKIGTFCNGVTFWGHNWGNKWDNKTWNYTPLNRPLYDTNVWSIAPFNALFVQETHPSIVPENTRITPFKYLFLHDKCS